VVIVKHLKPSVNDADIVFKFIRLHLHLPSHRNVIFFAGQGRTMVYGEACFLYAAAGNLRRTPLSGKKKVIYERKRINAQ
jgi:hypothetical protein